MTTGLAHSVQQRLVRHAHALGIDPNLLYARYASERLLYRLARSPHADRFVLKGALMLHVWLNETIRPTRDVDLLGFGPMDEASLRGLFMELCVSSVEPDGLDFDASTVRIRTIRLEDPYGGQRAELAARLGNAKIRV
jgi:predicted nucleotidyltransferase component of viral defense system